MQVGDSGLGSRPFVSPKTCCSWRSSQKFLQCIFRVWDPGKVDMGQINIIAASPTFVQSISHENQLSRLVHNLVHFSRLQLIYHISITVEPGLIRFQNGLGRLLA